MHGRLLAVKRTGSRVVLKMHQLTPGSSLGPRLTTIPEPRAEERDLFILGR